MSANNSDLRAQQARFGAIFTADGGTVPASFGPETDRAAWTVAFEGVALCDRSHCGLLGVTGADCLQFLHNQTTNDIKSLAPGAGALAAVVNSTARVLDLATIYAIADAAWVSVSPGQAAPLLAWFDRYVFPSDRVELTDLTPEIAQFGLIGPHSRNLLTQLGATLPPESPHHSHCESEIAGTSVRIAAGTGLALPGYTLMVASNRADTLWQALGATATPLGNLVWEQLRVCQGRPLPGRELTDAYNPLEAGLWSAVSLHKGCYIGQETIARLHTHRGVKQRLWRVKLSAAVAIDSAAELLDDGDRKIGTITSAATTPAGELGLAYVRTQAGGPGLAVRLASGVTGVLADAPFLDHAYP